MGCENLKFRLNGDAVMLFGIYILWVSITDKWVDGYGKGMALNERQYLMPSAWMGVILTI